MRQFGEDFLGSVLVRQVQDVLDGAHPHLVNLVGHDGAVEPLLRFYMSISSSWRWPLESSLRFIVAHTLALAATCFIKLRRSDLVGAWEWLDGAVERQVGIRVTSLAVDLFLGTWAWQVLERGSARCGRESCDCNVPIGRSCDTGQSSCSLLGTCWLRGDRSSKSGLYGCRWGKLPQALDMDLGDGLYAVSKFIILKEVNWTYTRHSCSKDQSLRPVTEELANLS